MDYSGGHVFLNVFKMSGSFLRSKRGGGVQFKGREMYPKSVRAFWKGDEESPLSCCTASPIPAQEVNGEYS